MLFLAYSTVVVYWHRQQVGGRLEIVYLVFCLFCFFLPPFWHKCLLQWTIIDNKVFLLPSPCNCCNIQNTYGYRGSFPSALLPAGRKVRATLRCTAIWNICYYSARRHNPASAYICTFASRKQHVRKRQECSQELLFLLGAIPMEHCTLMAVMLSWKIKKINKKESLKAAQGR